jgi:ABC-type multidrug transport system fused ATPase/permease subunit
MINPLNAELNPICHLLALLGVHHILHVSRIMVKSLILRLLMSYIYIYIYIYTGCFKKSFTTLKAYRNLYRGHTQSFELSKCSKTHRVLPRIVIRNCFDLFFRFLLHGTSTVTPTPKSNGPYRSHNNDHYAHD